MPWKSSRASPHQIWDIWNSPFYSLIRAFVFCQRTITFLDCFIFSIFPTLLIADGFLSGYFYISAIFFPFVIHAAMSRKPCWDVNMLDAWVGLCPKSFLSMLKLYIHRLNSFCNKFQITVRILLLSRKEDRTIIVNNKKKKENIKWPPVLFCTTWYFLCFCLFFPAVIC